MPYINIYIKIAIIYYTTVYDSVSRVRGLPPTPTTSTGGYIDIYILHTYIYICMYVYYLHIFGYNLHIHIDTSIYNCIILYIYISIYIYGPSTSRGEGGTTRRWRKQKTIGTNWTNDDNPLDFAVLKFEAILNQCFELLCVVWTPPKSRRAYGCAWKCFSWPQSGDFNKEPQQIWIIYA